MKNYLKKTKNVHVHSASNKQKGENIQFDNYLSFAIHHFPAAAKVHSSQVTCTTASV